VAILTTSLPGDSGIIIFLGLIFLGFVVGVLSGLFGVGGGFLMTPMLNAVFGIPYNIAVGSGLAQMVGTSAAASLKHRSYGHIDYKLVLFTLVGSLVGAELGARILVELKGLGSVTLHSHLVGKMYLWLTFIYLALLLVVGIFMFLESRKAKKRPPRGGIVATKISRKIQEIEVGPLISLRVSRIASISVWSIILMGFLIGILSGLLGVGGGFIITPAFIYFFGVPTTVAVGTGLFQIIFTSGYGALTHFFKGNVDFTLVTCILAGSLIGSQFGAMLNKRLRGAYVRYYFSWVIFIATGIIILKFLFNLGYFDWLR
jgi:hypothetical protein